MPSITHTDLKTLTILSDALDKDAILCSRGGTWNYYNSKIARLFCQKFTKEEDQLTRLCTNLSCQIKKEGIGLQDHDLLTERAAKLNDIALKLQTRMDRCQSKQAKESLKQLKRSIVEFRYRVGYEHCGLKGIAKDATIHTVADSYNLSISYARILTMAETWKKKQLANVPHSNNGVVHATSILTQQDKTILQNAARYHHYIEMLTDHPHLQDEVFKWILHFNLDIKIIIQMPHVASKLKQCFVAAHAARVGKKIIQLQKNTDSKVSKHRKYVALKCQNHYVPVDSLKRQVQFKHSKDKLESIFFDFAQKKDNPGKYSIFQNEGLIPWAAGTQKKDSGKQLDVSQPGWENTLRIYEEITGDEVIKRYGRLPEKAGDWLFILTSTKERPDMDVLKTHGYFLVVRPTTNGKYRVDPWGKYPQIAPHGITRFGKLIQSITELFSGLRFLGNTVPATIQYPDNNQMYYHRCHAYIPFNISSDNTAKLMDLIAADIQTARKGKIAFTMAGDNCVHWPYTILNRMGIDAGDLIKFSLFDCATPTTHGKIVHKLKNIKNPKKQTKAVIFTARVFGGYRGIKATDAITGQHTYKSLCNHPLFINEHKIYHPGLLHQKVLNNSVVGIITYGPLPNS